MKNALMILSFLFLSSNLLAQDFKTPQAIIKEYKKSKKKVITFIGYSGKEYEDPKRMLELATKYLKSIKNPQKYIVNIGVTPEGIGQIYEIAKSLKFETRGIVSALAKDYLTSVKSVDKYYLVQDETWGGYTDSTQTSLNGTSEAMVAVSDYIIGFGGGDIGHDELLEGLKRGKQVKIHPFEFNRKKAIEAARKKGIPEPVNFYGKANDLVELTSHIQLKF